MVYVLVAVRPLPEFGGIDAATEEQVIAVRRLLADCGYRARSVISTTSLGGICTRAEVRFHDDAAAAQVRDAARQRFAGQVAVRVVTAWC